MSENIEKKVNVAVIGAGYWGKNLVRNFADLGALKAICDSDQKTLDDFSVRYPNVITTKSTGDILKSREIDAVAIATPAETHYDLTMAALNAGKAVFVEKPLCLDVAMGEKLVEQANRSNLILMVGHLLQYHPAVKELKRLVKEGELGRLQYIYSNRLNLGKIRTEENILWSFAPHDISVILALAGHMPDSVSSFGSHFLNRHIADVTLSNLTFQSGVTAHIFVSWLHPFKEQKLVVIGDKKMAVFDDMEKENKLVLYPHVINWRNGVPVADKKEGQVVKLDKGEPLAIECQSFIQSVRTGVAPFTDGPEGLNVLRALSACQKSMETGGQIINLKKPSIIPESLPYFVHETSIVDEGCSIGAGSKIWHFSHVLKGSTLGEKCNVGQNVVIGPKVRIGKGCKIQNNVSVYEGVELEDNVFCGPSMVFTNVINPRSHIERKSEYKATLVREGVTIGANATIVCGVTLGKYSFIGAGAVVTKDAPDHALMVGNPARWTGWMCKCGEKLDFKGSVAVCGACGLAYTLENGAVHEKKLRSEAV